MRWDQMTGFTGMLVNNVVDFSTYQGNRVALLRTRNITANGVELFDLAYLDFETMQVVTLLESIPKPPIFALSPDERWIAYSTNGAELTIHALELQSSNKIVKLGTCQPGKSDLCDEITWSHDSLSVLWADSRGVWVSSIKDLTQQKVHPNTVSVQDPVGDAIEIGVTFHEFIWSPQGRYALAEVVPNDSDVRWRCILDTRRLRLVEVPESYKTEGHQANAIWLQDGSLLVVNGIVSQGNYALQVDQWKLMDTRNDLLVPGIDLEIRSDVLPPIPASSETNIPYSVRWMEQNNAQQLLFGISRTESDQDPILYSLDLIEARLEKIGEIPRGSRRVLWTLDGSGALVLGDSTLIYITNLNELFQLDLEPILGDEGFGFIWLPPAPRS